MEVKGDLSSSSLNIEIRRGETLNVRLGDSKNTMKVVTGETGGSIDFLLQEDPTIKDGGSNEVRDAGKINSYAQIEFNLEPEEKS